MQLHIPVLLNEILTFAKQARDGIYLDATLGYAGHASAILQNHPNLRLIGFDQDEFAILKSRQILSTLPNPSTLVNANFSQAFSWLKEQNIQPSELSFVLADIGVSSVQLDFKERGFSYESPELDMRMSSANSLNAAQVVNEYSPQQLAQIFCDFGELSPKLAADIAEQILRKRPIKSAIELSDLIGNAKLKGRNVLLKTLIFQAIRIEVNQELEVLKQFLNDCRSLRDCLLAIISFHSLEDKIIKEAFKSFAANCSCDKFAMRCECSRSASLGKILTKKPITPSPAECASNPRSSCAKLRVFAFKAD